MFYFYLFLTFSFLPLFFIVVSSVPDPIRLFLAVFRIRINMFLGLPDPDLLFRSMDPDPPIIKQNSKKNLGTYCFVTSLEFLSLKMM